MNKLKKKTPFMASLILKSTVIRGDRFSLIGDFEEEYFELIKSRGVFYSWMWYWRNVIKSVPKILTNSTTRGFTMFKSYMKTAYRNLKKNKLGSIVNILGLSGALAVLIWIYLFVDFITNMDTFHENLKRIYLVENIIDRDGQEMYRSTGPTPLGRAMQNDFPQIETSVRVAFGSAEADLSGKKFTEGLMFADKDFFKMFTFSFLKGSESGLREANGMIITEKIAEKWFGTDEPMGQTVSLDFGGSISRDFIVKAVAEDPPIKSNIRFSVLLPLEARSEFIEKSDKWDSEIRGTFILVENPAEIESISSQMQKYKEIQNLANVDVPIKKFHFEPLETASSNAYKQNTFFGGSHPSGPYAVGLIGLLILASACFNYVNIAIAASSRRMREIGLRKVVGSSKLQLVMQFIGENVIICIIALIGGVLINEFFFIPAWSGITNGDLAFVLDYTGSPALWIFFAGILGLISLGAGLYPALFVSSFQPIDIFRKMRLFSGKRIFTRMTLSFQFLLSFVFIIFTVALYQNHLYTQKLEWGYDYSNVISVQLENERQYNLIKNEIASSPDILEVSGTVSQIGIGSPALVPIDLNGEKHDIRMFEVGYDYLELMGFYLSQGRSFNKDIKSDIENALIINETMVIDFKWDNPIGQIIEINDESYSVIGVLKDFHYESFFNEIKPAMMRVTQDDKFNHLIVKTAAGKDTEANMFMKSSWERIIENSEYTSIFQERIFNDFYDNTMLNVKVFWILAFISLAISCMGLLGLVSIIIVKREKEIGMHKILGAKMGNIVTLLNGEFIILLVVASALASAISYPGLDALIPFMFKYNRGMNVDTFILTFILLSITAGGTVMSHIIKAVRKNPIDTIRYE